jgi:hypothetical protein
MSLQESKKRGLPNPRVEATSSGSSISNGNTQTRAKSPTAWGAILLQIAQWALGDLFFSFVEIRTNSDYFNLQQRLF